MIIIKEILKKIILLFLSIKVIYVLRGLDLSKKNLFIDLGTNLGQGFNYFIKFFKLEKFDYLLVEPNPNLKDHINSLILNTKFSHKIEFINKAAYFKNSRMKLFGTVEDQRGKLSEGASIIKEHNSKSYESIDLKCYIKILERGRKVYPVLSPYSTKKLLETKGHCVTIYTKEQGKKLDYQK